MPVGTASTPLANRKAAFCYCKMPWQLRRPGCPLSTSRAKEEQQVFGNGQVLGRNTTCRRAPTAPIRRRNSRSTWEGACRTPLLSASNSTVRPHPTLPILLPQPGGCIQTKLANPPAQSCTLGSDPFSNRVQMSPYHYQV